MEWILNFSEQSPWKANEAMGIAEKDVEVEIRWKRWIDEASVELGIIFSVLNMK